MSEIQHVPEYPGNDDAYVLGLIASAAGHPGRTGVGDSIDRGLILSRLLREYGYGLTRLPEGRATKVPASKIEFELMPTWAGAIALWVITQPDGIRTLELKGWTRGQAPEIERLRRCLVRYGDRVPMATSMRPDWQQTIDDAFEFVGAHPESDE